MKRRTLWTKVTATVVVLSLMISSIVVISADTAGSGGGILSFADGAVKVDVPQGAVSADVDITYVDLSGDAVPASAPAGAALGSNVFSLTVDPATDFKRAVNVIVAYTADDVAAGPGTYDSVKLYAYDAGFKEWQALDSAVRDIPGLTLTTGQTTIAGTYAIIVTGVPPTPTPTPTPEPTPEPPPKPPKTGDLAPGSGLLLWLATAGLLLVLSGGYLFLRRSSGSRA